MFYFPFAIFIKSCGIKTVNFRYATSASDKRQAQKMPQNLAAIRHGVPRIKSIFVSTIWHCALVCLLGNPALFQF
jgi:hypothetical protein